MFPVTNWVSPFTLARALISVATVLLELKEDCAQDQFEESKKKNSSLNLNMEWDEFASEEPTSSGKSRGSLSIQTNLSPQTNATAQDEMM